MDEYDDLSNYRLKSHTSFLSKLIERVVILRLVDYLFTNSLLNYFRSAYIKNHFTKARLILSTDLSIFLHLLYGAVCHVIYVTSSPTLHSCVSNLAASLFKV